MEVRIASEESVESVFDVRGSIEIIADRTADKRHQIRRPFACCNAADHEPVLPSGRYLLHQLLGVVVINRYQAIVEIHHELVVVIAEIAQRLAELLVGQHVGHSRPVNVVGDLLP